MSGFDSSKAVETLDWDFTAFAGPEAKGTIPEPSQLALTAYSARMSELFGDVTRARDGATQ